MFYFEIVLPCPTCEEDDTTIGRVSECDQCYGSGTLTVGDFYSDMDEVRIKHPNLLQFNVIR